MADLFLDHGSYLGIILVLMLTGCGLPLPEEVPIVFAGVASSLGKLNPWMAFASCIIGVLAGDCLLFWIGYSFGRNLVNLHPRLAHLLHAEREARMEELISRHGLKVLFVARFLVFVRAPVYLTAGVLRTSFRRFVLVDLFCVVSVVTLFFGLSYAYGEQISAWLRGSEIFLTVVVVTAIVVTALVLWLKRRGRRPPTDDATTLPASLREPAKVEHSLRKDARQGG